MPQQPRDPFRAIDDGLQDDPLVTHLSEAKELALELSNRASLSSVAAALHESERRDIELVALLGIVTSTHQLLMRAAELEGLGAEDADARWLRWLGGPVSDKPLDEL